MAQNGKSKIDGSNLISDRFSCYDNIDELYASNEYLISLSSKLLAKDGVLLYKIQDTVTSGKPVFTHLYVIDKAKEYGLELIDIFILTAKNRIISSKHSNQKHARKYHSFILIFNKISYTIGCDVKEVLSNCYLQMAMNAAFAASVPVMKIRRDSYYNVRKKDDNTKVTDGDIASHNVISQMLTHSRIPVVSEESNEGLEVTKCDRFWMVDPIDGTREYSGGGDHFSTNIALIENSTPVVAVIYFPSTETLYFAVKGKGAYIMCNVSNIGEIFDRIDSIQRLPLKNNAQRPYTVLVRKFANPSSIAALGTKSHVKTILHKHPDAVVEAYEASIKFCLIAEGSADYYFHTKGIKQWDVACGQLLVTESGGRVVVKETQASIKYHSSDDMALPAIQIFGKKSDF